MNQNNCHQSENSFHFFFLLKGTFEYKNYETVENQISTLAANNQKTTNTNSYSLLFSLSWHSPFTDIWEQFLIPDRLVLDGTIVSYSPSQINANDSVKTWPQNRFVDKSMAMVDVKHSEISKQIRIRTNIDLKCEAICLIKKK